MRSGSQWDQGPADLARSCFKAEASHVSHPEQKQLKRPEQVARKVACAPDQLIHQSCAHSLATLLTTPANTTAVGKATAGRGCAFLHHSVFALQLAEHQFAPSLVRCPSSLRPWASPSCRGAQGRQSRAPKELAGREQPAAHAAQG